MPPKKKPRLLDLLGNPDSSLALLLIRKWAWGHYSANEVYELANRALEDQLALLRSLKISDSFASQSLQILAGIGSEGMYPGNMRRDLIVALGEPPVPEPVYIRAPMLIAKPQPGEASKQEVDVAMYLPHEMVSYMYREHRAVFQ